MNPKQFLSQLSVIPLIFLPSGCRKQQVRMSEMAGRYEFHSGNAAQGLICFELHTNGTYELGNAEQPLRELSMSGSADKGRWSLGKTTEQVLLIGHSNVPIERTHSSIRVTVNDDLGMYCDLPIQR